MKSLTPLLSMHVGEVTTAGGDEIHVICTAPLGSKEVQLTIARYESMYNYYIT